MKIKSILSAATIALLLGACSGGETSNTAAPAPETSGRADTLVYYFGQIKGAEFLKEAARDSLLDSDAGRQEYLRGVKAGLEAVKSGKDAYNKGLMQGVQMAGSMGQFYEDYGIPLSDKIFIKGMSEVVTSDSTTDLKEAQSRFYKILNEFNREKEMRDKEASVSALKAAGEALGMKQISEELWGTPPSTDANLIKDGDKIKADVAVTTLTGKSVGSPFPRELVVGQRLSNNPVSEAFTCLASGETGTFLTSARALFGARAHQLGLKPADVVKLTVTPTLMPKENEKKK